jgi:hypothetical protein
LRVEIRELVDDADDLSGDELREHMATADLEQAVPVQIGDQPIVRIGLNAKEDKDHLASHHPKARNVGSQVEELETKHSFWARRVPDHYR